MTDDNHAKIRGTLLLKVALDEEDCTAVYNFIQDYEDRIATLEAKLGKCNTTLEFYGAYERYERIDLPHAFVRAIKEEDAGSKARATLEEISR